MDYCIEKKWCKYQRDQKGVRVFMILLSKLIENRTIEKKNCLQIDMGKPKDNIYSKNKTKLVRS